MLTKQVQHSKILHQGIQALRTDLKHIGMLRSMSTSCKLLNDENAKVQYCHHTDDVFEFKLNVNKTLNSIDDDMCKLVIAKLKEWKHGDSKPKAVMISGTGGKAFCAGGDIVSLYRAEKGEAGFDPIIKRTFFETEYIMDYNLTQMSPVQIAIWNGIVMGGGVGVSCHSPIRVATDNTMYAMPETAIGFFTDVGGSYFLPRINNNVSLGLYLGLTGYRLKAKELVKWGVATHFVPADKIDTLKADLSSNVTSSSSQADIEGIVARHADQSAGSEPIKNIDEINKHFKADGTIHDIINGLENSGCEFSKQTLKTFKHMSPLSLGVVFEQIKRGQSMNLAEVFEMEFNISQGFMSHTEFFEGVRALLVDKDRNPQWKHKSIHEVTQDEINWFFNFRNPDLPKIDLEI